MYTNETFQKTKRKPKQPHSEMAVKGRKWTRDNSKRNWQGE